MRAKNKDKKRVFSKSILIFVEEDFEDRGDDEEAIFVLMIRILF